MNSAFQGADVGTPTDVGEILLAECVSSPAPSEHFTESLFQFHLLNPQKER